MQRSLCKTLIIGIVMQVILIKKHNHHHQKLNTPFSTGCDYEYMKVKLIFFQFLCVEDGRRPQVGWCVISEGTQHRSRPCTGEAVRHAPQKKKTFKIRSSAAVTLASVLQQLLTLTPSEQLRGHLPLSSQHNNGKGETQPVQSLHCCLKC